VLHAIEKLGTISPLETREFTSIAFTAVNWDPENKYIHACYDILGTLKIYSRFLTPFFSPHLWHKKNTRLQDARIICLYFFIYNLNQQSEFTFYKLMLWLLQCLDGESFSGESPVPQIRSIGQFLLSRLFSSLVLRSGFTWVSSLVWCLLHFWWMTSCTYNMPRSACSVALETYHGASTIILRILDWLLCIIEMLDLLAQPHNPRPYVQIGMILVW
jgi:hypothetical protein